MKSWAWARRAACSTASSLASGRANAMLSRTEAENRNVSCETVATDAPQLAEIELAHVDAVDEHPPGLHVVEPRDQRGERRLARARAPDQRERAALGDVEIDLVQDRALGVVAEAHALEPQLAAARRAGASDARACFSSGSVSSSSNTRLPEATARCTCPTHRPTIRSGSTSRPR